MAALTRPAYDFTIWSSLPAPPSTATPQQTPTPTPTTFSSQRFNEDVDEFSLDYTITHLDDPETLRNSTIENYAAPVTKILNAIFPGFPHKLLEKVVSNASTGQNVPVIPRSYKHSDGFSCLINRPVFFRLDSTSQAEATVTHMGFLPMATWIGQLPTIKPLNSECKVFIICTDSVVGNLIASHYSAAYETRWTRLQKTPLWMFADLLHIFGDWDQVWSTTKSNLVQYHHQIHEVTRTTPLLQLTRALHDETAKILSVSEQLRVHASAVARFLRLREVIEDHGLAERAQEHFEDIQYHEETSQVILRQLENMTSLAFNIETMTQGQAVARLNVLAFAFLPISWVASIFGMTRFSLSAVWYPLCAVVVLVFVVSIPLAFPIHGFYRYVLGHVAPRWLRSTKDDGNLNPSSMSKPAPAFHSGSDKKNNAMDIRKDNDDDQAVIVERRWKPKYTVRLRGPITAIQRPSSSPHYNRTVGATLPTVSVQMPDVPLSGLSAPVSRAVGATLPIISETTEPQQSTGRWLNYGPMLASLQSSLSSSTHLNYTRNMSSQVTSQIFELSAVVEQSVDSHVLSSAKVEEKKDTSTSSTTAARLIDLEAQRSDSSS